MLPNSSGAEYSTRIAMKRVYSAIHATPVANSVSCAKGTSASAIPWSGLYRSPLLAVSIWLARTSRG